MIKFIKQIFFFHKMDGSQDAYINPTKNKYFISISYKTVKIVVKANTLLLCLRLDSHNFISQSIKS